MNKKCGQPAVALFPWGGKIVLVCKQHLKQLMILNSVIGGVQEPRACFTGSCEMPLMEEVSNE